MAVWTIARLTFKEAVRRRIALAALLLGLAFLIVFNLGFHLISVNIAADPSDFGPIQTRGVWNFLTMAGLYVINILVTVMAALITAGTLASEISSGVIQSIVTKAGAPRGDCAGQVAGLRRPAGALSGAHGRRLTDKQCLAVGKFHTQCSHRAGVDVPAKPDHHVGCTSL
jgi:hypothetical protein